MKTTRRKILEYLQAKQAASPAELGRALHLTAANIRHHLAILSEEGVVEVIAERPSGRPGRPAQLFGITQQTHGHHLDGLAQAFLLELAGLPAEERSAWLKKIARRMAMEMGPAQRNPTQRLVQAVKTLNAMNYQARWEAHKDGPRVILAHCPYAAIQPGQPDLCRIDALLLEEILGSPVSQQAKLEINPQGLPQCIFSVVSKL